MKWRIQYKSCIQWDNICSTRFQICLSKLSKLQGQSKGVFVSMSTIRKLSNKHLSHKSSSQIINETVVDPWLPLTFPITDKNFYECSNIMTFQHWFSLNLFDKRVTYVNSTEKFRWCMLTSPQKFFRDK